MRALLLSLLLVGCAHQGLRMPGPTGRMGHEPGAWIPPGAPEVADSSSSSARPRRDRANRPGQEVAQAAANFVGCKKLIVEGESWRYDCSGMVEAAYAEVGFDIRGSSRDLYAAMESSGLLHRDKAPRPGDIAFFDNTYDRNHDRRRNDELSHVGIVEEVDADGTITLVHLGGSGVTRIKMNLRHPHDERNDQGERINDILRSGRDGGEVLTGELWRAFGSAWRGAASLADA